MNCPIFTYLDVGSRRSSHLNDGEFGIEIETQYSVATLKADKSERNRIAIYTDNPYKYSDLNIDIVDITKIDALADAGKHFVLRLKPAVLLHALRQYGGVCVFLDSDTYIRPGFTAGVNHMTEKGALLYAVKMVPPVSHFPSDISNYPHPARHNPSRTGRPHGNSGVIGLRSGWGEPILEDALWLIDRMLERGKKTHVLEQAAMFETVWLHGRVALDSKDWIYHYCSQSRKRFMHSQIKQLFKKRGRPLPPMEPCIDHNVSQVKMYQYYWDIKRTVLGLPGR